MNINSRDSFHDFIGLVERYNTKKTWSGNNVTPYVKDAIHELVNNLSSEILEVTRNTRTTDNQTQINAIKEIIEKKLRKAQENPGSTSMSEDMAIAARINLLTSLKEKVDAIVQKSQQGNCNSNPIQEFRDYLLGNTVLSPLGSVIMSPKLKQLMGDIFRERINGLLRNR